MLLTEDEAKTKWCPFVRASIYEAADNDVSGNRAGPLRESGGCIASGCMAWRWVDCVVRHKKTGALHNEAVMQYPGAEETYERLPQRGYCGLGGRPE